MSQPPEPVLYRHADHDPGLICRPALGYGLCEVLEVKDGSEEEAAAPVMLRVGGKRFACERCGASVFSRAGENFACNGCGTLYGDEHPAACRRTKR